MLMTISDYAEYRKAKGLSGGTRQAVHKAIRDKRIVTEPCGKIDSNKADKMWIERTMLKMPPINKF